MMISAGGSTAEYPMNGPGRSCPTAYGYSAADPRRTPREHADVLYVAGGLYGNEPALDAVENLVAAEDDTVALVFNGDFNWFNVDAPSFRRINERVLSHAATSGNVEYELAFGDGTAGCGCAYPADVDEATVARSNEIHAQLRQTATGYPAILQALADLPRFRVFQVGDVRVGIVHGDAESLAGWRFGRESLGDPGALPWLEHVFGEAEVDGFASTHTCLPVCRQFAVGERVRFVINNGAAGMPNFAGTRFGVVTRIGRRPSPRPPLYGLKLSGVFVDALAVEYDHPRWIAEFLANWPLGSPAHCSYWERIVGGPRYTLAQAMPSDRR